MNFPRSVPRNYHPVEAIELEDGSRVVVEYIRHVGRWKRKLAAFHIPTGTIWKWWKRGSISVAWVGPISHSRRGERDR